MQEKSKVLRGYDNRELKVKMLQQMKLEVANFGENFDDETYRNSAWGHHYFCPDDGNVLTFDLEKPQVHRCSLCGRTYVSGLLDRAWRTNYRNEAATTVLKAAIIYRDTHEEKYLAIAKKIANFYLVNFKKFRLHNKEDEFFEDLSTMKWGCGRVMPQNLNEAIFYTRIFTALNLIKEELTPTEWSYLRGDFATDFYELLAPQVTKIHNIPLWLDDALGVVGIFTGRKDLQELAFAGEFNVNKQLAEGVTQDGFWYEGSIHYNCFTIEGLLYLALFCKEYQVPFAGLSTLNRMLHQVYAFAFSNQTLPNPNDGWPSLNLKTYSYLYAMGTYIFDEDAELRNIYAAILTADYQRTDIPLSKPYYYQNQISLEEYFLYDVIVFDSYEKVSKVSQNFTDSNYVLLTNGQDDLFLKYGHNGPSHAHPDKMNLEVVLKNQLLLKDLSNSGYGSKVCNEWHRMTASHNTVVVDGTNQVSTEKGQMENFAPTACQASAQDVYPGVTYQRALTLTEHGFSDDFVVTSASEHTYDLIFHLLATPKNMEQYRLIPAELGYQTNGYQYFSEVQKFVLPEASKELVLTWEFHGEPLRITLNVEDKAIYYCQSPSNPISEYLPTIIIRGKGQQQTFASTWKLVKEEGK